MDFFELKVKSFHYLNQFAKKGEIVFTGSSLCEQFPVSEMLQNIEPRIRVYNRGIGGDVTEGLMKRMEESVFELEPRKVFINIGTNDISRPGYTREKLYENYKKILLQIRDRLPDTKIYVMSYYPVNREIPWMEKEWLENMFGVRTNGELIAVNSMLEKMAQELHCTYINVFDCLLDENGNQRIEYTIDGMHMFPNGYAVVLEKLMPYLLEE